MRLLAFITLLSLAAHAQTATGTISVVAEDSSQAVVPRATISVTNKQTNGNSIYWTTKSRNHY